MNRLISACVGAWISCSNPAAAAEPQMSGELRESYRALMDRLAPEPVINKGSDGQLTQLTAEDAATVAAGRVVYHNHCAVCHGVSLQGQPDWQQPGGNGLLPAPPHDDSGHTWHHADDQLFEMVKYGPAVAMGDPTYQSMMPAFQHALPDNEINAVLVFIRSTWSEQQARWQRGANDAQTGHVWWREQSD